MRQMTCMMLPRPPRQHGRKMNAQHRWRHARAGDVCRPLAKVDRVRGQLADRVYPLDAHLDDVLESLLTMLSRRPV